MDLVVLVLGCFDCAQTKGNKARGQNKEEGKGVGWRGREEEGEKKERRGSGGRRDMTSPVCYWTLKPAQGDLNQSVPEYVMFAKTNKSLGSGNLLSSEG